MQPSLTAHCSGDYFTEQSQPLLIKSLEDSTGLILIDCTLPMATGRSAMDLAVFKILKISGPAISNPVSTLDPGFNYLRNSSINLKISTSEIHIILHIKTKI